jgi:hypothetical protein
MSYNRQAIADALAKMNKARKPKQPKDIIKDPEGQYKYPGIPTRIPSDEITMQDVPYPVLGVDNLGNEQVMQPGKKYVFSGADYVDEFPIAKYGGLVTGLTNTSGNLLMNKKGKRMMAQSGSLSATNKMFLGNPLVTKRKKSVFVPGAPFQEGGSTDWKSRIASAMKFQQGGQLSREEFERRKAAYKKMTGRDFEPPKSVKPSEKARQQYQEKYNQQPVVQSQSAETVNQSRGVDTKREKEIIEAQANTDAKAAENYMHFYNKTYGSDYGTMSYEQALQKVKQPNFDKEKYLNMYNLGQPKDEQLQSFREADQANRTWEIITNPFTAFEYAVATGDMANMHSNINAARMQGHDVGVTPGRNMVGNALNMTTNLFDAGDKVIRNVGEGNYLGTGLEAMRFLPGSRLKVGVNKTAKKIEPTIIKNSYDPTPRQNKKIIDYSEKPILPKDREPYIGRKILKADKDQQIFESFLSGDILDKHRNSRIINYTQEEAQALEALEALKRKNNIFEQGGSIQPLDYFDTELTDQEIEQYKKGGCVVVKL